MLKLLVPLAAGLELASLHPLGAAGATNSVFITFEPRTTLEEKTNFSQQEIAEAKLVPESRPADQDPEGNWGPASEGFQLSVRFSKPEFTNGEPVTTQVILRNLSQKTLFYPLSTAGTETAVTVRHAGARVRGNNEPRDNSFLERVRAARVGSEAFWMLSPGTQRRFSLALSTMFDLRAPGEYTVQVNRRVTNVGRTAGARVVSGQGRFTVLPEPSPEKGR